MFNLFRYLNPLYLFRDRTFDFIEQVASVATINLAPLDGVPDKKMQKGLVKLFGKDYQWAKDPLHFTSGSRFDRDLLNGGVEWFKANSRWYSISVFGTGFERLKKFQTREALNAVMIQYGWQVRALGFEEEDYGRIIQLVNRSLIPYRDVAGGKIKELPERCPYCALPFTNHVQPKAKSAPTTIGDLIKGQRADGEEFTVVMDEFEVESDDDDDMDYDQPTKASIGSYGTCDNCDNKIIDLTNKRAIALFKEIYKAEQEVGYKLLGAG